MMRSPPQHPPIPPRGPVDWSIEDPGEQIIAQLCDAVRTGAPCFEDGNNRNPHEASTPAISPGGFNTLTIRGLWPRAMRAISELGNLHPQAQRRFHRSWAHHCWMVRGLVNDDDIYFKALRVIFPPYRGPAKTLWRGQLAGMWAGVSWTSNNMVAERYAFQGLDTDLSDEEEGKNHPDHDFRIPRHLAFQPLPNRRQLILQARMTRNEIITKLPERKSQDPEFQTS